MRQRPINIFYLIDELVHKGGTEKHLRELACGMADRGHRVTVASLAGGAYGESFREIPGVDYLVLGVKRIYDREGVKALIFLRRLMVERQIDILQTFHTGSDLVGPLATVGLKRRPRIFSSRRDLGYTKSARHVRAQRLVNCRVDGIFANSEAVREAVLASEGYTSDRIWVIYNGIDTERGAVSDPGVRQKLAEKAGLNGDTVVVGSVGNIRPVKGFDVMVEAAGLLAKRFPALRFLHAGCGELNELEVRCRQLGIDGQFSFMGSVEAIPEFLSLLDVYIQPSYGEGFSNAIMEAMAAGLPVVATAVGGNIEIVEQGVTGFLVEPGDAAGIAGHVTLLAENGALRREMGENGRCLINARHDFEGMVRRYEKVFYDILRSS